MELSETLLWFFVFLPHGITLHLLAQDGHHPEKSPVTMTYRQNKVGAVGLQILKTNSPMFDIPQMSMT